MNRDATDCLVLKPMKNTNERQSNITRIAAKRPWYDLRLEEVFRYRDLILLLTKRSFQISFKQTILGPLWLFLNPLITSVIYTVVFGHIAGIQTAGVPGILFYLTSTGFWNFFAACVFSNASVFTSNAYLFGKVYFPRLAVPISQVFAAVIRFLIQMSIVLVILLYHCLKGNLHPHLAAWLLIPVMLLILGIMGMSVGILLSSMTTKYRDLSVLVGFGMNLWMFATPVIYPYSQVPIGWIRTLAKLNPITPLVELFRYAILGVGEILPGAFLWSVVFTMIMAFISLLIFNKVEQTFMDTV